MREVHEKPHTHEMREVFSDALSRGDFSNAVSLPEYVKCTCCRLSLTIVAEPVEHT